MYLQASCVVDRDRASIFFSLIFSLRPRVHEICDALRVLVQSVQFKKREKHPWRSVIFSKVAGFIVKKGKK